MKRILAVILSLALILTFTGCHKEKLPQWESTPVENLPAYLQEAVTDLVDQGAEGVFLPDPLRFATLPASYLIVFHQPIQAAGMDKMSIQDGKLYVTLKKQVNDDGSAVSVYCFPEFSQEILISNIGEFPPADFENHLLQTTVEFITAEGNKLKVNKEGAELMFILNNELSDELHSGILRDKDMLFISYVLTPNPEVISLAKIDGQYEKSGHFVGYADNNIIEVTVSDEAETYFLSERAKLQLMRRDLRSGEECRFEYIERQPGNNIITKFFFE